MARLNDTGEWRLYFRDHKWWWKWPVIGTTFGVWLGAMLSFVVPWQSSASLDDVETRPATTEQADDLESEEADSTTPEVARNRTRFDGVVAIPRIGIDQGADEDVVQSLTPRPPTATTPTLDDDAEVTETTGAGRRPPSTERTAGPEPVPPSIRSRPEPVRPGHFHASADDTQHAGWTGHAGSADHAHHDGSSDHADHDGSSDHTDDAAVSTSDDAATSTSDDAATSTSDDPATSSATSDDPTASTSDDRATWTSGQSWTSGQTRPSGQTRTSGQAAWTSENGAAFAPTA